MVSRCRGKLKEEDSKVGRGEQIKAGTKMDLRGSVKRFFDMFDAEMCLISDLTSSTGEHPIALFS
jgi:hypothetical protein